MYGQFEPYSSSLEKLSPDDFMISLHGDSFEYNLDTTMPVSEWLIQRQSRRNLKLTSKQVLPKPKSSTTHCFMIDAGSGGSRLHIFEFGERKFDNPSQLSDISTDSRWTSRLKPGLATFVSTPDDQLEDKLADYLRPLISWARDVLSDKKEKWSEYPIFLKATGGMRTLSHDQRGRILATVRKLFRDKEYQPFRFTQDEQARVISGEEEVRTHTL